ncbi:4-(cytidine 5'-diphospho)-2-C-methyl-D-erythritol kinase [Candidatus Fermentibacteria bacterium]|nr:4-(cytidine 5'-diphospho)-2-C-methyl-D-erythritol kinase [Candidatus Fermentibacteria bacterium]
MADFGFRGASLPSRRMISRELSAQAKINLGLRILSRRPDGYHDIRSVFQTVSLADRVKLTARQGPRGVRLSTTGLEVAEGTRNLAYQAAESFIQRFDLDLHVEISIDKRIPVSAGLGGGSSDAAAVLRSMTAAGPEGPAVVELAGRLGCDVPFFLEGGAALVEGRGEVLTPLEPFRFWAVLMNPGVRVGSGWAYDRWDREGESLTDVDAAEHYSAPAGRWLQGEEFPLELRNDFLPIVAAEHPSVARAAAILGEYGATWGLSGSGPTLYALFHTQREAEAFAGTLPGGYEYYICRSTSPAGA